MNFKNLYVWGKESRELFKKVSVINFQSGEVIVENEEGGSKILTLKGCILLFDTGVEVSNGTIHIGDIVKIPESDTEYTIAEVKYSNEKGRIFFSR